MKKLSLKKLHQKIKPVKPLSKNEAIYQKLWDRFEDVSKQLEEANAAHLSLQGTLNFVRNELQEKIKENGELLLQINLLKKVVREFL